MFLLNLLGICDKFVVSSHLLTGVDFGYESQKPLFKNVDFGIDMESRSKSHMSTDIMTGRLMMVENMLTRDCLKMSLRSFFCFSMYCWAKWSW